MVICPTGVEADDPRSYYKTAERIRDERGAYLPYQYHNQANPQAHYRTTGPEIWRQTEGRITHWVCGIGTGGTISGAGRYLKERNPDVRVVGVDTVGSIYAYLHEHGEMPPPEQIHQYLVDGIGEDFLPGSVWMDVIDEVITVDDATAYKSLFELARREAIFTGSSGGAAVAGARRLARRLPDNALVVTLLPDSGERYLSSLNAEWLRSQGLLGEGETIAEWIGEGGGGAQG
jgi:cystathionine beta-synthase